MMKIQVAKHHLLLLAAQQVLHEAMTHHLCLWDQLSDELLAIIQALSIRTSCCCDNVATSVHGSLWSQGYGNWYESSRHWQGTFIQTIIILGVQLGFSRVFFWNLLYFPSCRMVNIPIHGKLGTTTPRLRTMFVNAGLISQSCQGFLGGYSYPFYTAHVVLSIYMCVYICVYIRVYIDTTSWNGPQKLRFWFKPTKSNLSPILVAKNPGERFLPPQPIHLRHRWARWIAK